MRHYGPTTRAEFWAMIVRAYLRKERNQVVVGNVVLYVVGLSLIALVVLPR